MKQAWVRWFVAGVLLASGTLYYRFDPAQAGFFPPCPLRALTGLPCPGCGSQRCLHQLLHGNLHKAFALNPLLVLALPYVALGMLLEYSPLRTRWAMLRQHLYGYRAAQVSFVVIIVFWLFRLINRQL
jgi:hypothetical protein